MDSCSYQKLKSIDIESSPDAESVYPVKPAKGSEQQQQQQQQRKKNRRGSSCLKTCLCVTLMVVGLLLVLSVIAGAFFCKWLASAVRERTVEEPRHLPIIKVSNEELEVFKDEAKLFFDQIQANQAPGGNLVVTDSIANGFAAKSDFLRGNMFTEMKPNEITVSVSLPVDSLPGGKGRYFVGVETLTWDPAYGLLTVKMVDTTDNDDDENQKVFYDFQFSLEKRTDGRWNMEILSGQFFDWTVPQECIEKHENILEDLYDCDKDDDDCKQVRKVLEQLDGISLEDGQVVFLGRGGGGGDFLTGGGMEGGHRLLAKAVENMSSNYKAGWKGQLARRLLAF